MEPLAIVGLSLKFPQDATSPEAFWEMLMRKQSGMTEVPKDRFNVDAHYIPCGERTNVLNVRGGHFVKEDLACFDAPFFSITPAEAECMDPSQRWALEQTYLALENAGLPMESVTGSTTSVFMGTFTKDYEYLLARDPNLRVKYKGTGTGTAILANRISWFFDLKGPSVSLDTACSSSLYALHLASQSLRCGESEMAIVGGCNLFYNPDTMITETDLQFLSPESKCHSFDHRANGYARGEGIGVVVIKRLSKALEDGNTIRAVIRATAANQDGRTPGITQPSSTQQEHLIRQAYRAAGLPLEDTTYFEAHGTGTALGDPLEASAISNAFSTTDSDRAIPLYVGAVKSNIGHLEAASGVAGLIKTVLALENGVIPPNIWFEKLNPKISETWNLKFPIEAVPWPTKGLRRASINSFGFGGSNCHCVLDDAYNYLQIHKLQGRHTTRDAPPSLTSQSIDRGREACAQRRTPSSTLDNSQPTLLVWSSYDEGGTNRNGTTLGRYLQARTHIEGADSLLKKLAYTLSEKRSNLAWKSCAVVSSLQDAAENLDTKVSKPTLSAESPSLTFIFTGQGAQWTGMGLELMKFDVFRESLQSAQEYFKTLGCEWLLIEELQRPEKESNISKASHSQPICTAIQIALVDLLEHWNVLPSACVGHSSGEIAAAYAVGALSRESAWKIGYFRGLAASFLRQSCHEPMGMMAVTLSASEIEKYMEKQSVNVTIACENSPSSTTISGSVKGLETLEAAFKKNNLACRKLPVDVAYHSSYMEQVSGLYRSLINSLSPRSSAPGEPRMYSSVSQKWISQEDLSSSSYWVKNLLSRVRFFGALEALHTDMKQNDCRFVEIGPHAALKRPLLDTFKSLGADIKSRYTSILMRGQSALLTALGAAGKLYCEGCPIDLSRVNQVDADPKQGILTDLPGYSFDRSKKYWKESRISKNYRFRRQTHHDLLGSPDDDWNPLEAKWRNTIVLAEQEWLKDHVVNESVVFPAAGMLLMAVEALRQLHTDNEILRVRVKDVDFKQPLMLPSTPDGVETSFILRSNSSEERSAAGEWREFCLYACEEDKWKRCCVGFISADFRSNDTETNGSGKEAMLHSQSQPTDISSLSSELPSSKVYSVLQDSGFFYGPQFQILQDVSYDGQSQETKALIQPHDEFIKQDFSEAILLDAIIQLANTIRTKGASEPCLTPVPSKVKSLCVELANLHAPSRAPRCLSAKLQSSGPRTATYLGTATFSDTRAPFIAIELQTAAVPQASSTPGHEAISRNVGYHLERSPCFDFMTSEQIHRFYSTASSERASNTRPMVDEKRLLCLASLKGATQNGLAMDSDSYLKTYRKWAEKMVRESTISNAKIEALDKDGFQQLATEVEGCDVEGRLIAESCRNLRSVLSGKSKALEFMFQDDLLEDVYRSDVEGSHAFDQLTTYLTLLASGKSNLKVLEIGAGTGGATARVLEALSIETRDVPTAPSLSEYVFTDISTTFFENARNKFSNMAHQMTFKKLDVTKDPEQQGFNDADFDLVIAANVLHATPDLGTTLENVRRLIKPDGRLLLYEMVRPDDVLAGTCFGLLPDWWHSTEEDRQWSPALTEQGWDQYLRDGGFEGVSLCFRDYEDDRSHVFSVMISGIPPIASGETKALENVLLTTATPSKLQSETASILSSKLEAAGCGPSVVTELAQTSPDEVTGKRCIILDIDNRLLSSPDAHQFEQLQAVVGHAEAVTWATHMRNHDGFEPPHSLMPGLVRCIRAESKLKVITVAFECLEAPLMAEKIIQICSQNPEASNIEYVEEDGLLCSDEISEDEPVESFFESLKQKDEPSQQSFNPNNEASLKLEIQPSSSNANLNFVFDTARGNTLGKDEVEVVVKSCGILKRDAGVLHGSVESNSIGLQGAGCVTHVGDELGTHFQPGDRVCFMAEGCFRTYVCVKKDSIAKIPDKMTFEAAACLPLVYCCMHFALTEIARLRPEDSILLYGVDGDLGPAAVSVARALHARSVLVAAETSEGKAAVAAALGIAESDIYLCSDPSSVQQIQESTKNRGVDLCISLASNATLETCIACLKPLGRLLQVSDGTTVSPKSLSSPEKAVTFSSFDLTKIPAIGNTANTLFLSDTVDKISQLDLKVEPHRCFKVSDIHDALDWVKSVEGVGTTVVTLGDEDLVPVIPSTIPSRLFDADATYLIAGGLGGIGQNIAQWMADKGARHLMLLSRSKKEDQETKSFLQGLERIGVNVVAVPCDITDEQALHSAVKKCMKEMPQIKGCVQATMVSKDGPFEEMSFKDFQAVVKPKVQGSWNLHKILPKDLDFFILLSSVTGLIGNIGQANYASANTYLDGLARYRVQNGQKAISIDLGPVSGFGYAARQEGLIDSLRLMGLKPIQEKDLHALLESYCDASLPVLEPPRHQIVLGLGSPKMMQALGLPEPHWMSWPMFRRLRYTDADKDVEVSGANGKNGDQQSEEAASVHAKVSGAESAEDATTALCEALKAKLARITDLNEAQIDADKTVDQYGVDSLGAVEIRNWFGAVLKMDVPVFDITGGASLLGMCRSAVGRMEGRKGKGD